MRSLQNKRGQGLPTEYLGWTILILAGLAVLGTIIFVIGPKFGSFGAERACQASIAAKAQLPSITNEVFPAACRTQQVVIKDTDTAKVLNQVSELMASCSTQFLRGDYEEVLGGTFDLGSKKRCFVCYEVKTPAGMDTIKSNEIKEYLIQKEYANNQTYYSYLVNDGKVSLVLPYLEEKQDYVVAFGSKPKTSGWSSIYVPAGIAGAVILIAVPFTFGVSLAAIPVLVGSAAIAGGAAAQGVIDISKLLHGGETSTIYVLPLNAIGQACSVQ